jgi:nucleoside-diphosphate-sugar epimerase
MITDRTILITGVTGNQGGAVAQSLQGSGFRLRGFQFRDEPPSREAMANHRRSRLCLREFAKNSRILPCLRPAQIEPRKFSSLVNLVLRTPLAFG